MLFPRDISDYMLPFREWEWHGFSIMPKIFNGQVTFWKGGVTSQGMNRPLRKIHRFESMSHHLFQKGTSTGCIHAFFFFGGGVLDFPRFEARARWIGLNEFPLQICFWVLTPSSTKYIAVVFFPYILYTVFFPKKNETRDFVLNHTFPRITVQVNKF